MGRSPSFILVFNTSCGNIILHLWEFELHSWCISRTFQTCKKMVGLYFLPVLFSKIDDGSYCQSCWFFTANQTTMDIEKRWHCIWFFLYFLRLFQKSSYQWLPIQPNCFGCFWWPHTLQWYLQFNRSLRICIGHILRFQRILRYGHWYSPLDGIENRHQLLGAISKQVHHWILEKVAYFPFFMA